RALRRAAQSARRDPLRPRVPPLRWSAPWLSWKPSRRVEVFETGPPQRIFGDRDRGFGVTRAPLGVDDFDVRRRASAVADVGDVDDLLRLLRRGARAGQRTIGACHRFA